MPFNRFDSICKDLKKTHAELQRKLKNMPEGRLCIARNGGGTKWYRSVKGQGRSYLPKKEKKIAEQLAAKEFFKLQDTYVSQKIQIIDQLALSQQDYQKRVSRLESKPGFQELLGGYLNHYTKEQKKWTEEEYVKNPQFPEKLNVKTFSGEFVRSKSEMMILNALFKNKIPYRYECMLQLKNGNIYFPDFTILSPLNGQLYYWEHFGMFDNPGYREKAFRKLIDYSNNQIYPTVNLILTYETADHPFDEEQAEKIIRAYFL